MTKAKQQSQGINEIIITGGHTVPHGWYGETVTAGDLHYFGKNDAEMWQFV